MVNKAVSILRKVTKGASTLVLIIPARMVQDSKFPFKEDEKVLIEIDEWSQALVIKKVGVSSARAREKEKRA